MKVRGGCAHCHVTFAFDVPTGQDPAAFVAPLPCKVCGARELFVEDRREEPAQGTPPGLAKCGTLGPRRVRR